MMVYSIETINKSNKDLSPLEFYIENGHYKEALNGDTLKIKTGLKTKNGSDSIIISVTEKSLKKRIIFFK